MEVSLRSSEDHEVTSKKGSIPRKSVRSVMQSPYTVNCPVAKDVTVIKEMLMRLLAPIRRKIVKRPWPIRKEMKTEDKKKARKEANIELSDNQNLRLGLLYGMNAFIRGIEAGTVASAILSDDIQPKFLLSNLVELGSIHHVPVIVFPTLNNLTKCTLGFGCSSIAVKKSASENENSHFYPLHKVIMDVSKENKFPEYAAFHQLINKKVINLDSEMPTSISKQAVKRKNETKKIVGTELDEKESMQLKNAMHGDSAMDFTRANSSRYELSHPFKKKCQEERFSSCIQNSQRIAHPYLRSFLLENHRMNKIMDMELETESQEVITNQPCDRNIPSVLTPSSSCSGRKEESISFHPYKSVRITEISGSRKTSNIKSSKN